MPDIVENMNTSPPGKEAKVPDLWQNRAKIAKNFGQRCVGATIAALLVFKALLVVFPDVCAGPGIISLVRNTPPLTLVGTGLMYAAGFDLAFMLFTDGPDEAVQPAMLGIAAALLITASKHDLSAVDVAAIPLLALSIGFLFLVRARFVQDETRD